MIMTHEKPNGLLETCAMGSPDTCPVKTPHHMMSDTVSAIMWNEIKKTVKTAQAAWPGVDFDLTLANKVLDLITSGKVDARDVEVSVVVADLERQVVPDGDAKDESVNAYGERCPDLMTNLDRWRAEKSPFRLHDGASSWRLQSEAERDDEPGVILMEDDGTLDDSIVREINRRPSRGIKDVYCVDVIRFGHQPLPLKVVASTPLSSPIDSCFTDDPDIFWSFVANPLGRPFRIKRNGVVEPTVYPAGCVFLYPTTPKGNKVLIQERPIFVVDASANPKFPLPIGFQKIVDDRLSRRSLFDWDIVQYAIQHDIDYRQAADEHLNIVQREIAKNKIDTAWNDSHRIEGWTHR